MGKITLKKQVCFSLAQTILCVSCDVTEIYIVRLTYTRCVTIAVIAVVRIWEFVIQ